MKAHFRMSSDYNCAYHDLMLFVDNSFLNPVEMKDVKEEVYQMMQESDKRHIPLPTLFPQGLEAFGKELVRVAKHQTWWQLCLQVINFFVFAILLVLGAEYLIYVMHTHSFIPPSVFDLHLPSFLWSLFYVSLMYGAAMIRKHNILKLGKEKIRNTIILFLVVTVFIFANSFLQQVGEIGATLPFLISFIIVIILKITIHYILQMSFHAHIKTFTDDSCVHIL